jgi:hypothetical protein
MHRYVAMFSTSASIIIFITSRGPACEISGIIIVLVITEFVAYDAMYTQLTYETTGIHLEENGPFQTLTILCPNSAFPYLRCRCFDIGKVKIRSVSVNVNIYTSLSASALEIEASQMRCK